MASSFPEMRVKIISLLEKMLSQDELLMYFFCIDRILLFFKEKASGNKGVESIIRSGVRTYAGYQYN